MPKIARQLTALDVKRLAKQPGRHAVGGVPGLHLYVKSSGFASWVLRFTNNGKRTDKGLGTYTGFGALGLTEAREQAQRVLLGMPQPDAPVPFVAAPAQPQNGHITFAKAAEECHAAKAPEFRNPKHAAQWLSTLNTYAVPIIGSKPVAAITVDDVLQVLQPIWTEKTETATRVRQRMENVLAWAHVKGYRDESNPARWKGNLDHLLPKPQKIKKTTHHRALPYKLVPAFMVALRKRETTSARALELAILTAARSGEVRQATWSEIDLKRTLWTVPAERMKAGREHVVPLSAAALQLLRSIKRTKGTELVFPSAKNTPLSDNTLAKAIKGLKYDAVPHGFRSSFKDWARNETDYADEVSELCLAHVSSDATRAAYARDGLLELRAKILEDWAQHCSTS